LRSPATLTAVSQGDYAGAKPLFERAIAIGEKALGKDHPTIAIRLNNLALLLSAQGDYAGAKPLYERALGIGEKTLGPNHPDLATRLNNLARLLSNHLGDHHQALRLITRCVNIFERTLPADHEHLRSSKQFMVHLEQLCRQGGP